MTETTSIDLKETSTGVVLQLPTTLDAMVEQYVRLRDTIKAAEEANKLKLEPAKDYRDQLEAAILEKLTEIGVESARTKFGTAYKSPRKSATIADGAAFREFVTNNAEFNLVDWRANPTAVSDYISTHNGELPPGVNFTTFITIGVRRA